MTCEHNTKENKKEICGVFREITVVSQRHS